jgi:hypothetical protein
MVFSPSQSGTGPRVPAGAQIVDVVALQKGSGVADLNNDIVGASVGQNGVADNTRVRLFSEGTRDPETAEDARHRRFEGGENDSASRNVARCAKSVAEAYLPN